MKTVKMVLIGSRILALACGLTFFGGGCGGPDMGTQKEPTKEEQQRQFEDAKKAMEAAATKK